MRLEDVPDFSKQDKNPAQANQAPLPSMINPAQANQANLSDGSDLLRQIRRSGKQRKFVRSLVNSDKYLF